MTKYRLVFEQAEMIIRASSVRQAIARGRALGSAGAGELVSCQEAQ